MKVEANAARKINERGNQVLIVTGQVLSDNQQGVLPAGKDYEPRFVELSVKGGALQFSFEIEAAESVEPIAVPVLPGELSRQEQEALYLAQQLLDPNLTPQEKQAISEKLAPAEAEDAK